MAKLSYSQEAVFAYLADNPGITATQAIHHGANGRTLSTMTQRGWLVERDYAGKRVWELSTDGALIVRDLFQKEPR